MTPEKKFVDELNVTMDMDEDRLVILMLKLRKENNPEYRVRYQGEKISGPWSIHPEGSLSIKMDI